MATHVPEWEIERLALGRLTTAESLRVQRHLFKCGPCLQRLLALEILLAQKELLDGNGSPAPDKRKPLFIVHDTGDGFIYSKTERRGRKWFARNWGKLAADGKSKGDSLYSIAKRLRQHVKISHANTRPLRWTGCTRPPNSADCRRPSTTRSDASNSNARITGSAGYSGYS